MAQSRGAEEAWAPAEGLRKHVLMVRGPLREMNCKRLQRQELRLSDFQDPERDVSVDSGWFGSALRVFAEA